MNGIRLHLLALPHTITRNEFSHCAFTGKVQRFAPMMRSQGYEVFHYGVETSQADASQQITILTKAEWQALRVESYQFLHTELTPAEVEQKVNAAETFIGDLGNLTTPLYKEFNRRLRDILFANYRHTSTDIVCLPFGHAHYSAVTGRNYVLVESGIGYPDSFTDYRIFESYAYLHYNLGKGQKSVPNYWFVAPNYYNTWEFPLGPGAGSRIGFFGRICDIKGCRIVHEVAKRFPAVEFVLCGQGDAAPFLLPNLRYAPPLHGAERGRYLGSLTALIAPSMYVEPFCGVNVEAQLCGTPVLGPDCGAFVETIEPFKTGLLCHTLQDYCAGIEMALAGRFDRAYIRARAVSKYDMYEVAKSYNYALRNILEIHNGANGWYSPKTFIADREPAPLQLQHEVQGQAEVQVQAEVQAEVQHEVQAEVQVQEASQVSVAEIPLD